MIRAPGNTAARLWPERFETQASTSAVASTIHGDSESNGPPQSLIVVCSV